MCQRLFIASRKQLKTVKRRKSGGLLTVSALDGRGDVSGGCFGPDREFLYLAGGHVVCGCGFPAVQADGEEGKVEPKDLETMGVLAEHLREACRKHNTLELYLCWVHEEDESPIGRRTVSLDALRSPEFRFRHREVLTVGKAP